MNGKWKMENGICAAHFVPPTFECLSPGSRRMRGAGGEVATRHTTGQYLRPLRVSLCWPQWPQPRGRPCCCTLLDPSSHILWHMLHVTYQFPLRNYAEHKYSEARGGFRRIGPREWRESSGEQVRVAIAHPAEWASATRHSAAPAPNPALCGWGVVQGRPAEPQPTGSALLMLT